MWPFSKPTKSQSKSNLPVEELIVDRSIDIRKGDPYVIQTGIVSYQDTNKFRAFFKLDRIGVGNYTIIPQQQAMSRIRATEVAHAWANALQVAYDMGLEQMVEDLD